ncbi:MAG TPA: hypothetical protein PKD09_12160 [Aggregatilinea sp.]|uniref:hypothetical protein n=1 Tax=Aggregatilinea sp. TaxID=2806333 RepID=UPI002CAFD8FA|nr:hypothetical protein [Aggregatilinea sp.]HML22397.1 hypothetical protein [Aggregatilinea sp.]
MEKRKSSLFKQSFLIAFIAVCMVMAVLALIIAFDEANASGGEGQQFLAIREASRTPYATIPAITATPSPVVTHVPTATPDPLQPTLIIDDDLQ